MLPLQRAGSGWAWLCVKDGKLEVCSSANQDNTLMPGVGCGSHNGTGRLGTRILLELSNRRPDYIAAFWNVVNWGAVADKYAAGK